MKKFKFLFIIIPTITLICLLVFLLAEKPENRQETTEKSSTEETTSGFTSGIDVSEYQGEIDWIKVKESGVEFAIIRLGFRGYGAEGNIQKDINFDINMSGALNAGVDVGIYFYSQAVNEQEAMEEADFVLENISNYYVEYPLVIDSEYIQGVDSRANNLTPEERTAVVKAFCKRIEQSGYSPGIYSHGKWLTEGMDLDDLSDYFIWLQDYNGEYTDLIEHQMLQYSNTGYINGINGKVDLDKFYDN